MSENTFPLVTIGVITYNSSKTIVETLDSIKSQTYPLSRIELIIGDDNSSDNTVSVVRVWLQKYGQLFNHSALIESTENKGIAHNNNQVLRNANGMWFKGIGGDDLLKDECIAKFVDFVSNNVGISVCFCRILPFGGDPCFVKKTRENFNYSFFKMSVDEQLYFLLHNYNCLPAPGAFICLDFLKAHNISCDERIPLLDDYPLWINMLRKRGIFKMIDEELVMYRIGGITSKKASLKFYKSERLFQMYYIFPEIYKKNPDEAIHQVVNEDCALYSEIERLERTKAYRIGKFLIHPISTLIKIFRNTL